MIQVLWCATRDHLGRSGDRTSVREGGCGQRVSPEAFCMFLTTVTVPDHEESRRPGTWPVWRGVKRVVVPAIPCTGSAEGTTGV